MEHKFVIEVRLRHEPPKAEGQPKPQGDAVNVDPKVLQSLLIQLPHALTALVGNQIIDQQKPKEEPKKKD